MNDVGPHGRPPANKMLMVLAGVFLVIPIVALLWVDTYARVNPTLAGFPFFIWYQFLWVFLCAICTWAAHRVVHIARPRVPMTTGRAGRKESH